MTMFKLLFVSSVRFLTILILFSGTTFHSLQSQNHFNYFGDEVLTFRHGHNWIAAQRIDVIYEIVKTGENRMINQHQFDHNGLPEKIFMGNWEENWEPENTLDWEKAIDFLYVMNDLFLRQETYHLVKKENGELDTTSTSVRYINFFNRAHYANSQGVKQDYTFDNNNRLIRMELSQPSHQKRELTLTYKHNRLDEVREYELVNGEQELQRSAEYSYDSYSRPSKILVRKGDQLKTVEIEYGTDGYPKGKRVVEDGEIVKEIEYIYIHKED